jgi:hypothetical protein
MMAWRERSIRAHTGGWRHGVCPGNRRWDGQADVGTIGALAAEVLSEAIVRAATQATASGGLPSARDLNTVPSRLK